MKKTEIEIWETRFGTSVRVVKRHKGQFVDNVSFKQIVGA